MKSIQTIIIALVIGFAGIASAASAHADCCVPGASCCAGGDCCND